MEQTIGELRKQVQTLERRVRRGQRITVALALTAGALVLAAFRAGPPDKQRSTSISVKRINVVEPDGRLAVVISNAERLPGGIIKGKEFFDRQDTNGFLFYNSEGTEAGGLTFLSERNPDGSFKRAFGHLSLDRFESDQVVALRYTENGDRRSYGLQISDFPLHMIAEIMPMQDSISRLPETQRAEAMRAFRQRMMAEGYMELQRLFVARTTRPRCWT